MLSPRVLLTAHNAALSLIPQDEEDTRLSGCNYSRACDTEARLLSHLRWPVGFCAARAPACLAPAGSPAGGTWWGWSRLPPARLWALCSGMSSAGLLPVGFLPVMESPEATGALGMERTRGTGRAVLTGGERGCRPGHPGHEHPLSKPLWLMLPTPFLTRQEWGNGVGSGQVHAG